MSINAKISKSIKKKDLTNTRNVARGVSSLKFHHQASANEVTFDLTSLTVPAGLFNPSPTALGGLRIKQFSENLTMVSNLRGLLMEDISYEILTDQSLRLIDSLVAIQDEVFTFTHYDHQISGALLVDVRADGNSGILLENTTDYNLGTPVLIEDLSNQWPIQVFRGESGTPMLRTTGNGPSDGNYIMLDNGDGFCSVIRFLISGDIGGEAIFWSTQGALAERPNDSVLQRVDKITGVVDVMRDDLLEVTGFDISDPTRYQGAVPTLPDLKAFGERVLLLEKVLNIEVLSGKQEYTLVQNGNALTNLISEVQFNLATAAIINLFNPIISAVDDAPNTRTKFIASSLCKVDISWSFRSSAGERLHIYKNGVVLIDGDQNPAGNSMSSGATMILQAGEFFSVGSNSSVQNSAIPTTVNFTAIAITKIKDLI